MKALVFDTETTSLSPTLLIDERHRPSIIELYAAHVDLATGEIVNEYESFFKPPFPLTEETKRVTKITDDMLRDAPRFAQKAEDVLAFMSEPVDSVIAHNVVFDTEVMEIELSRVGRSIRWPRKICTVEATVYLEQRRLTLKNLYAHLFNETFKDAHRAKPDTQALIRCATELYRRGVI